MLGSASSLSARLLRALQGLYIPGDDLLPLARLARVNKVFLEFLRRFGRGSLEDLLASEETRYRRFMDNALDVVRALGGAGVGYALYKFRRPAAHVSVDLDVLVKREDISKAFIALRSIGFEALVSEPYTLTMVRRGFTVDLYTDPAFAWAIYIDGETLLRGYAEDIEVDGTNARALSRGAEAVVAAAHAAYKEHIYLLTDLLVIDMWLDRESIELASRLGVLGAVKYCLGLNRSIAGGAVETPYRIPPPDLAILLGDLFRVNSLFRATSPNILKYLLSRRSGGAVITRLTRKSY